MKGENTGEIERKENLLQTLACAMNVTAQLSNLDDLKLRGKCNFIV